MKDGDVSMILKDVINGDAGTYECHVFQGTTKRRKRATFNTEPISTIHLEVQSGVTGGRGDKETGDKEGGDKEGNTDWEFALAALFLVVLAVGAVGFIVYRKRRGPTEQSSYKAAAPDEESPRQTVSPDKLSCHKVSQSRSKGQLQDKLTDDSRAEH
ncbi:hypothetical protein INR49_007759 [Caranx melampygus]|nr:hypothetical protein INR49_007759 [Caranx melampygus]